MKCKHCGQLLEQYEWHGSPPPNKQGTVHAIMLIQQRWRHAHNHMVQCNYFTAEPQYEEAADERL